MNTNFAAETRTRYIVSAILLLVLLSTVKLVGAQGPSVAGKTLPSVVEGGTFVALEGKFTISLPQRMHAARPLTVDMAAGRAIGDAYNWKMKEGSFIAGYLEAPEPLDGPEMRNQVFENIRNRVDSWARSQNGKLIAHKQVDLNGHPSLELKIELPIGSAWQRYYLVSRRLYEVQLTLANDQRPYEALALKVLDSFKVLSDDEVSAALKARIAEAEPSPLPQEPVVSRDGSDAADNGLRGKVKTVFQEDEDLSGQRSVQGRKTVAMEYYNERGNLTKREFYYKGYLFEITVYGYLDGARVARSKTIEHEFSPPSVSIGSPAGETKTKADPRYSNKFTFRYDDQKRLIEKSWFLNNGNLSIRYVYKYSGNQREEFAYTRDGSLNQHYLSILDATGHEIELTSFETKDGSVRYKYSRVYEFDTHGNWIKRTTSKWVTKDGKSYYEPAYVDYRTITYY